jgi:hypothetical protein
MGTGGMAMPSSSSNGGGGGTSGNAGGGAGMMSAPKPKPVVPPTPEMPKPCNVAGCPPSLVCATDGVCVTPPPACVADGDCKTGQRCGLTGECLGAGECRVAADCAMTESCRGTMCKLGSDCGQTELKIDPIPPNVLVLLDVSGSMCGDLATCNDDLCLGLCDPSTTKIHIAGQAVGQITSKYHDTIRWGLAMFPGDGACGAPVNVIAPAPNMADMVANTATMALPISAARTPINAAVASIQSANYLVDPARKNYMLLVSDGGESCGTNNGNGNGNTVANTNTTQLIKDMAAQGISTFVVGFGGAVDAPTLNDFANAGGMPTTTTAGTSYYQADSAQQLEMALGSILARVVGCDFAYTTPPTDPDKVWAFFDGVMVDRNDKNGWKLDTAAKKVTFVGDACMKLQSGTVKDVQVVFGCPQPVQG